MSDRPVSITHLVLGLIFAGIALIWLVGRTADLPGPTISGPVLLIGAGVVGLVVSLAGVRRRRGDTPSSMDPAPMDPTQIDPAQLDEHQEEIR